MTEQQGKRRFLVNVSVRDMDTFECFAALSERFKPFGEVSINVAQLAATTLEDVPPGGSAWHEYTIDRPVLTRKYFPHEIERPFLDMKPIEANVAFLRQAAQIARQHGLGAWFRTHEPYFMPEEFFEAHPELRGARLDHPRRSRREEFGICRDTERGREILSWSMAQLVREVPELTDLGWQTNDAGAGICWNEYLYPGPNGPDHCRHLNTGEHVANILKAWDAGAAPKKLDIVVVHANFTEAERKLLPYHIPTERVFWPHRDHRVVQANPSFQNPVKGIFNPLTILERCAAAVRPEVRKVLVPFDGENGQHELLETAEKVVEVIEAYFQSPASRALERLNLLRELCARWVGEGQADDLFEAFLALDEAYKYRGTALSHFGVNTLGVTARHITRPLVAIPEALSPEEERYFMPYVFNPREEEARRDYMDMHGNRVRMGGASFDSTDPRPVAVGRSVRQFNEVAERFERIKGDGDAAVIRNMAVSLRMHASITRSIGNFYGMQLVRERNAQRLGGEPVTPPKVFSWTGDPDLLLIHEYMRDELDNVNRLISLLEDRGGLERMATARDERWVENMFLLGRNLPEQLRRKRAIMRRHWLDASEYLIPPHK